MRRQPICSPFHNVFRAPATVLLAAVLLASTSLAPDSADGQEWTRFRGPNGTGESETKGIPERWTESDYAWKVQLPGIGHSSPVIWGDRVFLMSADPETARKYVLCLNAQDGETRWQRNYESAKYTIHLRNSFATPSPAVDEHHVYVAWATPERLSLMALDHDGEVVWSQDNLGPFSSQHGFGVSPIVAGDLVILPNQQMAPDQGSADTSSIMAFDRMTGEPRWQTPLVSTRASYSVPCLRTTAEGTELICCTSNKDIFALDLQTGRRRWTIDVFDQRTVSSPILVQGLVLGSSGSGNGGNYLVAVRPGEKPEVVFKIDRQAPYVPTPVAREDLVFLWDDKGVVTCIEATSGKVHWRERVGGSYSGSPVRVRDRIYGVSDDGDVHVLAASESFQKISQIHLGEPSRSTPAVSHGRMYLRTYSQLFCLGTGRP